MNENNQRSSKYWFCGGVDNGLPETTDEGGIGRISEKGGFEMRYASVCSGVEAAALAWMPLGWEPAWFSEIEPFPCEVLKQRFFGVPNLGDMTEIEGEKYRGTVDLLVGGTPCQGFSVAGKQGGLDDPRSALALAYVGLLETMRPRWFVWENVPGVLSTNGGRDFREFIAAITEIGYGVCWRVLDAQYVRVDGFPRAVPQRRRRVFLVGYYGNWRYPAEVLFEPTGLLGDTPPRRETGTGAAADAGGSPGTPGRVISIGNGQADGLRCARADVAQTLHCMHDQQAILLCCEHHAQDSRIKEIDRAPAIPAKAGAGGNNLPLVLRRTVRRLTPRECERLMGFPDDWTCIAWRGKPPEECPDSPRYKACGNSMCVNVMRWIGRRIETVEREDLR